MKKCGNLKGKKVWKFWKTGKLWSFGNIFCKFGEKNWNSEKIGNLVKLWKLEKLEIRKKIGNLVKKMEIWKKFLNLGIFWNLETTSEKMWNFGKKFENLDFLEIWKKIGNLEKELKKLKIETEN